MSNSSNSSYGQILKASSIIGGSQVVVLLIGFVRTKLVAVLLGPTGIGLIGLFHAVTSLASTFAGLGINNSGVRDVAEAVGSNDQQRIARTVLSLRRVCWLTGLAGFCVLFYFASAISVRTFGSTDYEWSIRLLGITVLLSNLVGGQTAIIQGTRRIGDIARIRIIGAIAGTIVSVGFYYWLGIRGIIPSMLATSIIALAVSTWFAQRVPLKAIAMSWKDSFFQAGSLVQLGLAFVWSGLLTSFVAYYTRVLITYEFDLVSVGIFSAAFALSGAFVQFVLGAMGADYYPRLTATANDHFKTNQIVNEQTEIGLLLAFPGLLATITFAPYVVHIFYTAEFAPAAVLLKWFVLGCMGRVIAWPMGFVMLAKGKGGLFSIVETISNVLHLLLIYLGIHWLGLAGVAVAFALLYGFYIVGIFLVTRQLTGFYWTAKVLRLFSWMIPVAILAFLAGLFLPSLPSTLIGGVAATFSAVLCLRKLAVCVGPTHRICRTVANIPYGKWLLPKSLFQVESTG